MPFTREEIAESYYEDTAPRNSDILGYVAEDITLIAETRADGIFVFDTLFSTVKEEDLCLHQLQCAIQLPPSRAPLTPTKPITKL